MWQNFFKTAFRNLGKHKSFSAINIAGLTLGLTACLLIGLFVRDEKQYDTFIPDGDRVFRVYNEYTNSEGTDNRAPAPPMFATTLKKEFPEVEQTARVLMLQETKTLFEVGAKKLYEQSGYFVDSTFFNVFPLPFVSGSPAKALDDPKSIVLSQDMANRLFGSVDPVGKQVLMNKTPLQVTGVFKAAPKFHLQFHYMLPLSAAGLPQERMESWGWQQFYNYVKVKKGANVKALETKFQKLVQQETDRFNKDGSKSLNVPHLQPLRKIHLYSASFKMDAAIRGNSVYVTALTLIAIFILLIACFNFINLATAKSLQRAKEVGVRKSIGASRNQLLYQFIGETTLLAYISHFIAVILTFLLLPTLNNFTDKQISVAVFSSPLLLIFLLLLAFVVGVLAGFYPALVLSRFQPVKVLKGSVVTDAAPGKTPWLRHTLVVVQFALSVLLIISALVVFQQVSYLHHKDLGFSKEQILFFPMRGDSLFKNNEAFKN
ncbi:MAG TPA: ABC transporter permease, partial [Chitinophagaceae bacterium]|nr:ABC transporter permease [Chitinophagaceae bacterium]